MIDLNFTPKVWKSKHYGNNRWFTESLKLKRLIHLYSDLEYDHWVLTETNPHVESFCEQPVNNALNQQPFVFDMWIKWKNAKHVFVEVKYENKLNPSSGKFDQKALDSVQRKADWCQRNGFEFQIVTELQIRNNQIYLENMKRLIGFLKNGEIDIFTHETILKTIRTIHKTSLEGLIRTGGWDSQIVFQFLSTAVVRGEIHTNLDTEPLSKFTEVWVNE